MFPWVDGFHWTFGHILFLSLFFAVVAVVVGTVIAAVRRTAQRLLKRSPSQLRWEADFADLPTFERHCRHELAGRIRGRVCDNAFECRECGSYSQFASLPANDMLHEQGIEYPSNRFYHRGHTWVEPQPDGTLAIGLDGFAERLVGHPDSLAMPEVGEDIELNGTAWGMRKNGRKIGVRAPIEGKVEAIGGPESGWYLKVRPRLDPSDPATLRHLLRGPEVHGWLYRELERLHLQLRSANAVPTMADGGVLVHGLMDALPEADWDSVLAGTFLES